MTSRNSWLLSPWLPLPATSSLNTSELEKTDTQFLQQRRARRAGQWRQGFGRTVGAELSGCVVAN